MTTFLQQLRAEYEASTQGEWSVFARQGLNPGEEEWFLGYEITGPEQPSRGQFVRRGDAAFCVSAHNHMPLLLAVLEAAETLALAKLEMARMGGDFGDLLNTPKDMRKVLGLSLEDADAAFKKASGIYDRAEESFNNAIEPLLEGEE